MTVQEFVTALLQFDGSLPFYYADEALGSYNESFIPPHLIRMVELKGEECDEHILPGEILPKQELAKWNISEDKIIREFDVISI